jgi:hypothetical protein
VLLGRYFIIPVFVISSSFGQEILRPTQDSNGGAISALQCSGTLTGSTAMPLSYDLAGLATSSTQYTIGTTGSARYATRIFTTWASTTKTYTALTLNINSASNGWIHFNPLNDGEANLAYSTDSGTTWHNILTDNGNGWTQRTSVIYLSPSQVLANLRVGLCTGGNIGAKGGDSGPPPGSDNLIVWDIWTSGTVAGGGGGGNGSGIGLPLRSLVGIN